MINSVTVMSSLLNEIQSLESKEDKINYLKKMIFRVDTLRSKLDINIKASIDEGLNPFEDDISDKIRLFKKMEEDVTKIEFFLREQLQDQKFRTIY